MKQIYPRVELASGNIVAQLALKMEGTRALVPVSCIGGDCPAHICEESFCILCSRSSRQHIVSCHSAVSFWNRIAPMLQGFYCYENYCRFHRGECGVPKNKTNLNSVPRGTDRYHTDLRLPSTWSSSLLHTIRYSSQPRSLVLYTTGNLTILSTYKHTLPSSLCFLLSLLVRPC